MSDIRITSIEVAELDAVVDIHTLAFPDSAITAFGPEAIRRYYRWLIEGPHDARLAGAWVGTHLVGFCAAGVFRGAMNGFLRANRRYLATRVLAHPSLLASPLIRDRVKTALRITLRFSRFRRRSEPVAPTFGVLSIATDPSVRGSGAGRALMAEAEARARSQGYARIVLTVHPDNLGAVRFYEQLDWTRSGAEPWTGSMVKQLG